MARVCTLYSGSSGNCTFVGNASGGILVDFGMSFTRTKNALEEINMTFEKVKAVIITHEHSDHIGGLAIFTKKYNIPIYASARTALELTSRNMVAQNCAVIPLEHTTALGDMEIIPFKTPHDSVDSQGYRIMTSDGRSVAVATDLGCMNDEVRSQISCCELVVLESNYDKGMLTCGRYPYYLKQRIMGSRGHLSNEDCARELPNLIKSGTTRIILSHLSQENNMPQVAFETAHCSLKLAQMKAGIDFQLEVAPRASVGKMMIF